MTCRRAADPRTRYYQLLQVAKRDLRWDEDTYRNFLRDHGAREIDGKVSATTMTTAELVAAVEVLKRLGFQPKPKRTVSPDWRTPRIKKAYAIWCALHAAGVVRDRGFVAFERWSMRLTGTAKLEWSTSGALNQVIEGLRSWAARERVELIN